MILVTRVYVRDLPQSRPLVGRRKKERIDASLAVEVLYTAPSASAPPAAVLGRGWGAAQFPNAPLIDRQSQGVGATR